MVKAVKLLCQVLQWLIHDAVNLTNPIELYSTKGGH